MLSIGAVCALGQQDGSSAVEIAKPLPAKQEMVRDRVRRLEDRMFRLYEKLAETEPENAAKLSAALEHIGQVDVDHRLERLIDLLADDARLQRANDQQEQLLADLEGVLSLLMRRGGAQARRKRLERLGELRRAVEELLEDQRTQRRDADAKGAAAQQRETAGKTGDLAERMKGGRSGGPSPDQPAPAPAPGQRNVEQARRNMDDAADDLDRRDRPAAAEDQDRAIAELEEARRELGDELQQLRREEREELLRNLEGRFAEMLSRQLAVNGDTTAVHTRAQPKLVRPDRLRVAELAEKQRDLAEEAGACLHILEEEGTTIAFPRVVEQIQQDMNTAADRLAELRTGPLTQSIQEEIANALRDLVDAVQRMQSQDDQPTAQGEQQSGDTPLLPPSAELKLLRSAQTRVNRRTTAIDRTRQAGTEPRDQIARAVRQIEERQRELADMTATMAEGRR